ncbi:DUF1857-domain-containing protein [Piedraia hortae CBS 480.64]|uniref:DUF1857-domain-containing protein n=1 Tax=Piedraia hortae CBS 480.64 TaxID=1314780 RepID=A0A6A7C053_9PEZI|nr:DUF1857-domain-containing protein [Piedraia hortae CBS 480.64]
MTTIYCAYTEPINPSGTQPVLTRSQVWAGLQRKIRRAQDFVPVIIACEVLEEKKDEKDVPTVVRDVVFKGKDEKVREVCKSYWPSRVDFHQSSGAVITNTLSSGSALDETDLYMTYSFEFRHDEAVNYAEKEKEYKNLAKMAVHESIVSLREMGKKGELGN